MAAFADTPPVGLTGGGVHEDAHRRDIRKGIFRWTRRRQPSPGAQAYSYDNHRVIEQPYCGDAVAFQTQFRSVQAPQAYLPGQQLVTTGLGGLVQGQMIMQPLIDPYD